MSTTTPLTVALTPVEANAIVYATCMAISNEAGILVSLPISKTPGDLSRMRRSSERVSRLSAVNAQLAWCAHWGHMDMQPSPLTTTSAVLLDITSELHKRAEEQRFHGPDEFEGRFAFDEAARTLAGAFAGNVEAAA
jgi:hypothetical protein